MGTKTEFKDAFGTPWAFPFKLMADSDGNFQDLTAVTATIKWENESTAETGSFTGATLSAIKEETATYRRYDVIYSPVDGDISKTGQLYNFKIVLVKTGLDKKIGLYKANVIE